MNRHFRRIRTLGFCLVALPGFLFTQPSGAEAQWRWEGVERQVVIPDVHGAYNEFVQLLKATGIVDENLDWVGGETHLVSLGDLLDRGPGSRQAMDLLMHLERQATEAGGKVHVILGNHEEMVLTGDLRYVSDAEFAAFAAEESEAEREMAFEWFLTEALGGAQDSESARHAFDATFPPGYFGFRAGFASDGHYGRWLLGLPTAIVINNTAYVHAGLPDLVAEMSLDDLNARVSAELKGYVEGWEALVATGHLPRFERQDPSDQASEALFIADPSRCIQERAGRCEGIGVPDQSDAPVDADLVETLERFIALGESQALSIDGPMWYRGSVYCKPILEEPVLDAGLTRLGADRVVVGHTPTFDRRAHSLYGGRLIMMDTGMLVSYYRGRPSALIVENGETVVQYLQPEELTTPLTGGQVIAGPLNHAAVLKALREGEVTVLAEPDESEGGAWRTRVRYNGLEIEALFYPDEAGELEQAAYVLDELMGLDLVPATVTRRVDGEDGALQLWYSDAITETQRLANDLGIGGWCPIDPQFDLMTMFDYLTFNAGRSEDNVLYRRSLWNVRVTGHNRAFGTQERLPDLISELEVAPGTRAALQALDEDTLEDAMDGLLSGRQIRALLARRDVILSATGAR